MSGNQQNTPVRATLWRSKFTVAALLEVGALAVAFSLVARRIGVEMPHRRECRRPRHVLDDDIGIARDVASNVPRHQPGILVVPATCRIANHDSDGQTPFSVSIIPHTGEVTNLGRLRPGGVVNLEADLFGKYVERMRAETQVVPSNPR